jgi:hypothetical protein
VIVRIVLAIVLATAAAGAAAQAPADARTGAPGSAGTGVAPSLPSRQSGTGRDQFIAPVMGIQIQGEGLNLPPTAEEEEPAKPAAKPQEETKKEQPRSTPK